MGWRVGCNPPSVLMRHSANRATRASGSTSSASVCPFHLQDGRFTVSHPAFSTTQHASSALAGWTFRFCSGAKALALRPCGRCNSTRGAEFPQAFIKRLESHTSTRQPKYNNALDSNKNFGSFILSHAYLWSRWLSYV